METYRWENNMTITWEDFINNHKPDLDGSKIHCKDNDKYYESRNGQWVEVPPPIADLQENIEKCSQE